jgi:serine/threonine-protein phosphatase 2A regulatory subunit B''
MSLPICKSTFNCNASQDLERLAYLLTENRSPPNDGLERINYDQFCNVCKLMPDKAHMYFTAHTFLKFSRDTYGRISTYELFQYICRKVNFYQARIQLSVYDEEGKGYLSEHDLETYVYELIPSLAPLQALQQNFYPFYVFTAVRKFLFFLDSKRTGKVAVKNILTRYVNYLVSFCSEGVMSNREKNFPTLSPILSELLNLRSENWSEESESSKKNWFSPSNALRVYSQYLELDVDHDGMLSKGELQRYGIGSFTEVFIDRVFQECHTYDGKMVTISASFLRQSYNTDFIHICLGLQNFP